MNEKNIIDLFPNKIIELLGGMYKFKTYSILEIPYKINDSISIGLIDNCPFFVLRIFFRNKKYKEVFKQKSVNNKEIWECSSNSYIFSKDRYNFYTSDQSEFNDINNIKNLINGKNTVSVYNYSNDGILGDDYLTENASLI